MKATGHARPVKEARRKSGVTVRAARAADIPQVVAIEREAFGDPWAHAEFVSILQMSQTIFLVADEAGQVAGYVVVATVLDEAEILNLAVAGPRRRGGIGSALLDAAIDRAEHTGTTSFYLEVRESNASARALYAAMGFAELARRRGYYRNPVEDALVLRRAEPG